MQISGYLPAPPLPVSSPGRQAGAKPSTQNFPDTTQGSARRQASEFIFDGEVIDDRTRSAYSRTAYSQIIDPANQAAISSYTDMQAGGQSQGRLLDIFI